MSFNRWFSMYLKAWAFLLVFGACCVPPAPPPQPDPEPTDDAGAPRWSCPTACARLGALGCDAGKPSPGGKACVDVCRSAQAPDAPPAAHWNVRCLTEATSCQNAEVCR